MSNLASLTRIEKDSMGEMEVPKDALWGAQTQRAMENFPISGLKLQRNFIQALGLIKGAAAKVNADLDLLPLETAKAIMDAAESVAQGQYDAHFPLDVFQTGSGTSTNMNANEVIAKLAELRRGIKVHPNDDVNMSQSSNDVIPTAIHISTTIAAEEKLLPALSHLEDSILKRAKECEHIIKTGRTHLMDAMPISLGQELSGWANQIQYDIQRLKESLKRIHGLVIGGTAVGTGINAHPEFASRMMVELHNQTRIDFYVHPNYFAGMSAQDSIVDFSGCCKTTAVSLNKIANDLRWMNSGPLAGLAEITLSAIQPGSSIMPGKVNPVICEAVIMAAAQIMGNDTAITLGGLLSNFQLNTMLPMIAYNILQSIELLSTSSKTLANKAIANFTVNQQHIEEKLALNPILVTALNPVIGYEKGAEIAKRAYKEKRPVLEIAKEMTNLSEEELKRLLDPKNLIKGGIVK